MWNMRGMQSLIVHCWWKPMSRGLGDSFWLKQDPFFLEETRPSRLGLVVLLHLSFCISSFNGKRHVIFYKRPEKLTACNGGRSFESNAVKFYTTIWTSFYCHFEQKPNFISFLRRETSLLSESNHIKISRKMACTFVRETSILFESNDTKISRKMPCTFVIAWLHG